MKRIIGYLGSKINLFDFLEENIIKKHKGNKVFIDVFAGTCSVGKFINKETNWDIISNDISNYSKILGIQIKLNQIKVNEIMHLEKILYELDDLKLIKGDFFNEFSMGGKPKTITDKNLFFIKKKEVIDGKENIYFENNQEFPESRMFFKGSVGQKIDTIRIEIKKKFNNKEISEEFKDLLLLFLLNYVNKNSNYTGVYGAYLKHDKFKKRGEVSFIDFSLIEYILKNYEETLFNGNLAETKQMLANDLIKKIDLSNYKKDNVVFYMDPPYSTRSYESNYHILNYICDLDFSIKELKENSKSGMKKDKIQNPFNSKFETLKMFKELIIDALKKGNHIYISYSNEGLMKQEEIQNIVDELDGVSLTTFKKDYKRYTSGENNGQNTGKKNSVIELLWYIKNEK